MSNVVLLTIAAVLAISGCATTERLYQDAHARAMARAQAGSVYVYAPEYYR